MRMVSAGALLIVAAIALSGCLGNKRLDSVNALSDESKELFAKYRQFMTEQQQEDFLQLGTDDERHAYVSALHVEDRLAKYPTYIQDAIWAQEIVPGMDAAAVLLTWSVPESREFDEQERGKGNDVQRWNYERLQQQWQIIFTNGVVTQVLHEGK
ncbi:MAG: hypothetical protein ACJ790_02965 [Myxococcaceae bacterium]